MRPLGPRGTLSADALARALRAGRIARGLRQAHAARLAGIHNHHLCDVEAGRTRPGLDVTFELSQLYGLSFDRLVRHGVAVVGEPSPWPQPFPERRFGAIVRAGRRALGLEQIQLGPLIDVSSNYLSRVERGSVVPSLAIVWRLTVELDLDLSALT